jgi:S-adenosylmethionine hydrolase
LAAYTVGVAAGDVVFSIVDPGVGTDRDAVILLADGRWFVGPDNGLLAMVARRARDPQAWSIGWRPPNLSQTFHGRDLFAPVVAGLANRGREALTEFDARPVPTLDRSSWAEEHRAIVYIDHYGNAITGWRAAAVSRSLRLAAGGHSFAHATTFAAADFPFWYENSNGLVELALNRRNAQKELQLALGMAVTVADPARSQ